jgi:hypothetical protein
MLTKSSLSRENKTSRFSCTLLIAHSYKPVFLSLLELHREQFSGVTILELNRKMSESEL